MWKFSRLESNVKSIYQNGNEKYDRYWYKYYTTKRDMEFCIEVIKGCKPNVEQINLAYTRQSNVLIHLYKEKIVKYRRNNNKKRTTNVR